MAARSPRFLANGTIQPSRFVKIDATAGESFAVIQASAATDKIIGVSQDGSYDTPGLTGSATDAARNDLTIRVHSVGEECLLELGGTVTQGDYLTADADGKGVTASGTNRIGATALQAGVSGEKIRVLVLLGSTFS